MVIIDPLVKKNIYFMSQFKKTEKFTLLIVGGSQGAKIFDNNLKNLIVKISKIKQIKVIQQTNENKIDILKNFYSENNVENLVFSYEKNFSKFMQLADLCITRAGASTLAELSILNIPFIAIPLPTSKDNHQFENAIFYKDNDCCWLIEQKDFENKIEDVLKNIISDKKELLKKKENLKKLNYQNTWKNVNQKILNNINEN